MTGVRAVNWVDLPPAWQACFEQAWRSYCAGSVPIGAAVLDPQGLLVAAGRNQREEGVSSSLELGGHLLAHAEINALMAASAQFRDLRGFSLVTLMEPCPLCVGAIAMAHIGRVEFAARDLWAGSIDLLRATPYMRSKGVEVVAAPNVDLEQAVLALNAEYWLGQPTTPARHRLLELWRGSFPQAVELAEMLHSRKILSIAVEETQTTPDVYRLLGHA